MGSALELLAVSIAAYALGGIPTALLIGQLFFGIDIRNYGSGNVGSTNALRVLGWQWGLIVQVIDILKGVLAVAVVAPLIASGQTARGENVASMLAGVAAVIGHCWSPWAGLRGGKGVNTAAGVLAIMAPIELIIGLIAFGIALLSSGYVSLGSLVAAVVVPFAFVIRMGWEEALHSPLLWGMFAITLIVLLRHRANIQRLLAGTEHRFASVWLVGRLRKRAQTGAR